MAAPGSPLRQRAEHLAATLPPLLVAARRVAATVSQGVHGRRRIGQGETFWQFREYEHGDPPQLIDWRQSAKSDRVFVREMEWEAAQSVWLWQDCSPSMSWRSSEELPDKRGRANLLALALSVLLIGGGERVALLGAPLRPLSGRGAIARLAAMVERGTGSDKGLPPVMPLPRHGTLVLFGDFLDPLELCAAMVRGYAERGIKGHIMQILDPAEESLPFDGRIRFEGLENEHSWLVSRVGPVRPAYAERLEIQREGLQTIARSAGWSCLYHRTDRTPESALLALYAALATPRGA